jgi:hypothetical protein
VRSVDARPHTHTQYIYCFVIGREEVSMHVGSGKNAYDFCLGGASFECQLELPSLLFECQLRLSALRFGCQLGLSSRRFGCQLRMSLLRFECQLGHS